MSDWQFTKEGWDPTPPDEVLPEGALMISMLTGHGDVRKIWNSANADEVEDAKRTWEHLVKDKKYMAFRVNPDDNTKGEQIREFDPSAGKMILVPPVRGG